MWTRRTLAGALLSTALSLGLTCGGDGDTAPPPPCPTPVPADGCWERLRPLGSGGFPAEPGSNDEPKWEPGKFPLTLFPVVAFGGELWMISQTHAFSSRDGLTWTQRDKVDWGERISQAYAFFGGRLWMFGGLDYRTRQPLRDIWSSSDGVQWQTAGDAAWPARKGQAVVVFQGKLWLFGGTSEVDAEFNAVRTLGDVWSSEDGVRWTQVTGAAPWAPRDSPGVVVLSEQLYLLGGDGRADVWRSADGRSWTLLLASAPWGEGRQGYGREALGGRLWVFGGFVGPSTNARNDVWFSTDGTGWTRQAEQAPWGPRSPRSIVYDDRIWIFSGKHTGASDNWGGDIWALRLPPQ
jgi:hypothetical protein